MEEKPTAQAPEVDSKFRLVLVAASRAEQLIRGARPKLDNTIAKRKNTRLAMDEVASNLVDWGYGPPPQPEPSPEAAGEEQPAPEVH